MKTMQRSFETNVVRLGQTQNLFKSLSDNQIRNQHNSVMSAFFSDFSNENNENLKNLTQIDFLTRL